MTICHLSFRISFLPGHARLADGLQSVAVPGLAHLAEDAIAPVPAPTPHDKNPQGHRIVC